jgi:hypothetical protein
LRSSGCTDIAQLADRLAIGFRDIDDAVQCYKVGATRNPWKKDYLRERIADALPFNRRARARPAPRGDQDIDILMRSVMGSPARRRARAASGRAACCSSRARPAWARPSSRRR